MYECVKHGPNVKYTFHHIGGYVRVVSLVIEKTRLSSRGH